MVLVLVLVLVWSSVFPAQTDSKSKAPKNTRLKVPHRRERKNEASSVTKSFSPRKSATKTHTYEYPFANVCAQVARETNYLPVCESTSIFKCRSNHARKQKEQRHHNVFVCLESLALEKSLCFLFAFVLSAVRGTHIFAKDDVD